MDIPVSHASLVQALTTLGFSTLHVGGCVVLVNLDADYIRMPEFAYILLPTSYKYDRNVATMFIDLPYCRVYYPPSTINCPCLQTAKVTSYIHLLTACRRPLICAINSGLQTRQYGINKLCTLIDMYQPILHLHSRTHAPTSNVEKPSVVSALLLLYLYFFTKVKHVELQHVMYVVMSYVVRKRQRDWQQEQRTLGSLIIEPARTIFFWSKTTLVEAYQGPLN